MSQMQLALSDPSVRAAAAGDRGPRTRRQRLQRLQAEAKHYRRAFNAKRIAYQDWHRKKSASFVATLKSVQCFASSAAAPTVGCVAEFRELRAIAGDLRRAGKLPTDLRLLDEFLQLWREFLDLKEAFELSLAAPLARLLADTDAFRHASVKASVLRLIDQLRLQSDERFDCRLLHSRTDDLFTYSLHLSDSRFLGLMQILPALLRTGAEACYFAEQLVLQEA